MMFEFTDHDKVDRNDSRDERKFLEVTRLRQVGLSSHVWCKPFNKLRSRHRFCGFSTPLRRSQRSPRFRSSLSSSSTPSATFYLVFVAALQPIIGDPLQVRILTVW
jgi:hypothetical protein